jgi:hypothetical protein
MGAAVAALEAAVHGSLWVVANRRATICDLSADAKGRGLKRLRDAKSACGWTVGTRAGLAVRYADGIAEHSPALAQERAALKPAVIMAAPCSAAGPSLRPMVASYGPAGSRRTPRPQLPASGRPRRFSPTAPYRLGAAA